MAGLFMLVVFLGVALFHYARSKNIYLRVYITELERIVALSCVFVFIFIAYKTRNDLESYIISISASLFFLSSIYYKGLTVKGIYAQTGRGLLILFIPFKFIKSMKIRETEKFLELKVESKYGVSYERFDYEDERELRKFIYEYEDYKILNGIKV